jgi:diketogulonate reductase-like aldo/keto reductase
LEYKELGNTGVQLPEIGLGTWRYKGGPAPIQQAIALGATHIDTAENYNTEPAVAEGIQGQREQVFIATKVSGTNLRYDEVISAANKSLSRLGIEYIDLYQLHWPNSRVPIGETMKAMEELVDAGKVKYIGVSNFSAREMHEAQESMSKYKIVSNQVQFSLVDRYIEQEILPYCQEKGITVIAFTPLDTGALATKSLLRGRGASSVLEEIAADTGKTMAQVALNWCTSRDVVIAIPKANRVEHVVENCGASGWRLTAAQVEALDAAFK